MYETEVNTLVAVYLSADKCFKIADALKAALAAPVQKKNSDYFIELETSQDVDKTITVVSLCHPDGKSTLFTL